MEVAGNSDAVILSGLEADTQYQVTVAALWGGHKYRSRPIVFRTLGKCYCIKVLSTGRWSSICMHLRYHNSRIIGHKLSEYSTTTNYAVLCSLHSVCTHSLVGLVVASATTTRGVF